MGCSESLKEGNNSLNGEAEKDLSKGEMTENGDWACGEWER